MCCHSGFVSFIEHRQNRFSIILKGSGIFRMSSEHRLQLKSLAILAPKERVSLSFEALKPYIDFTSLAMKVLDNIIIHYKPFSSALKIYCLV